MSNVRPVVRPSDNPWDVKLFLLIVRHKKISLYFNVMFVFLSFCGFVYIVKVKMDYFEVIRQYYGNLVIFLSCLNELLLLVVISFGILYSTKAKHISILLSNIFENESKNKSKFKSFKIYINIQRYLPFVPALIEIYFFAYYIGWDYYPYPVFKNVWCYIINAMMCCFAFVANKVTEKFAALNDTIEELSEAYHTYTSPAFISIVKKPPLDPVNFLRKYSEIQKSANVSKHYNDLCNLLDTFNKEHKPVTVAFGLCCTMNLLYYCSQITDTFAKPAGGEVNVKVAAITIPLVSVFASVGQAAAIAFVGENLQEEGERTSRICLKFLNKLRRNMKNAQEDQIVNELTFLLEQSRTRKICFHAGGFFTLNWGILGSIISTVATYSIVIIQFLLK